MANNYINLPVEGGTGVTSLNTKTGAITLVGGTGISVTSTGATEITITNIAPDGGVVTVGTIDSQAKSANGLVISGTTIYAQSADASFPGMLTIGTQTIAGNKTFTGSITASNLSGTNTGDVTLTAFGSTPNANGASLSGQALTLQPASATQPGGVSTTTQSIAGAKTFTSNMAISVASTTALTLNTTSFIFDTTNGALGIGVQPQTTTSIDIINTTGASKPIQMTGYGTSSTAVFRGRFARGTVGTPTAAQSGDLLGTFSARGYGATGFTATSTGVMNVVAGETFTDSSALTYVQFLTTPTGSVTGAESARIATTGTTLGPQSSSTAIHAINGGIKGTVRTITTSLTVDTTTTDYLILCNNSGAINVTLPTPTSGRTLVIKDKAGTAATNNVTVVRNGSEKIEGLSASYILQANFGSIMLISDGTDWWVI